MKCLVTLILISLILISNCTLLQWNEWSEWNYEWNYEEYSYYDVRHRTCSASTNVTDASKCCFDDKLSVWSSWSNCSEICKLNETISTISVCTCLNTTIDGNCTGNAAEKKKECSFEEECPEYLGGWSLWSDCTETCHKFDFSSIRIRTRNCSHPHGCSNANTRDIEVCDLYGCSDCRITSCNRTNEVCEADQDGYGYFCYCASGYFVSNGTCKECKKDCKDDKICRKYIYKTEYKCECMPNYLLDDKKCKAAFSEWDSWSSWSVNYYTPNSYRSRKCTLFLDANKNETQDCSTDYWFYLKEWSSWSDCSNASNRTRIRTCSDAYFGKNCTGAVEEQTQSCPGFAFVQLMVRSNEYLGPSSKNYKDLFENVYNDLKKWFDRFGPIYPDKWSYFMYSWYDIWYKIEMKDLFDSCKEIESYLAIMKHNISLYRIQHSDCCFSKLNPYEAFITEYFTGLTNLNLSLANVNFAISCKYDTSKSVNLSCIREYYSDMVMYSYYMVYDCPAENEFSQDLINLNKSITRENADNKAANLSKILDTNTNLSVIDINFVTNIITGIVEASTMPINVTENILLSVSSLLNQNKSLLNEANSIFNTSRNLLSQLDRMAEKQYTNVNVSTNNLAFSSYFQENNNSDVYIYSGNNNDLSVVISNNYPENRSEMYQYITLPSQLFFNRSKTLVYSYIYKEVDLFASLTSSAGTINSNVLSATLKNVTVNKSDHSILLGFAKKSNSSVNTLCGFFNTNKRIWSTDGCNVVNTSSSVIICECDHLTNFALLLNVAQSVPKENTLGLTIVTWIGCGLSIAGLFCTIVSYAAFSKLRRKLAPRILLSLCVSLMCTLIIFLALGDRTTPRLLCQVVASLLQFFVLSTFFWMAIEGLNLYRMFVKVFNGLSSSRIFLLKASAFAWGIPLVFTIATAVSKPDLLGPGNPTIVPQLCVVRGYPFYFGILLPICVIMTGNICFLFFVLRGIGGDSKLNNKIGSKKKSSNCYCMLYFARINLDIRNFSCR